ncbi:hypothetical protein PPYR_07798 [Photinus pyralis]|uniref:Uncharacterized protein n=1 Tax=Photinus pyralis TaxID=7054 RepID=A0A5N4ART1_PHOPY|nr:uncharacterized protein LOC116168631 [Photinus pyralis]KAB0799918.1 hypothetical protein PPYR_07798 [Photinus pyralis]
MKVQLFAVFLIFLIHGSASTDKKALIETYLTELSNESPLNFKVFFSSYSYHEDGSPKYVDTLAFGSDHHPAATFKLNSLGPKRVEQLTRHTESKGITLSLLHENFAKNKSKDYDTQALTDPSSPAGEVMLNKEGISDGILEALLDTLDETTNEAKIEGIDHFPDGKMKQQTVLTLKAKEVTVKGSKDFSSKMLEDGKKLIKRAFKIETNDRPKVIAGLFYEKFPQYTWEVYVDPITYTTKSEVMAKFNYDSVNYVVLGA